MDSVPFGVHKLAHSLSEESKICPACSHKSPGLNLILVLEFPFDLPLCVHAGYLEVVPLKTASFPADYFKSEGTTHISIMLALHAKMVG